ncbi:Transmembrane protein [Armadillidium nasatum]|uniref:Transmembrane protein n=1 Tax=Armadillidium nasatum TaxID=96803 RepID=A0A5N5STY1_9CRUS|nr:Transmembrane protein [Armadillidium nasatum]
MRFVCMLSLGMQLVLTMIMASVLSKVIPHYSFAKWILCRTGLMYYLHPSEEELKIAAAQEGGGGKNNNKSSGKNKNSVSQGVNNASEDPLSINIPRNISVNLEQSPINPVEVMGLRFYPDFQWLLDFSMCTAIVYSISEVFIYFVPSKEVNLSMLWCMLVIGKVLFSLTMLYFRGEDSGGEKSMVILAFFIYLLIALGILIISEEKLDLGLDSAYASFNRSASAFLKAQGLNSDGPASKVTFKILLAFMCALIGAFYTFPGLRLGRMHWDSLRFCGDRRIRRMVLHGSFLAPIIVVLLWVRPISRRYFTEMIFSGYSQPIMTSATFDVFRVMLVALVGVIRIALMPVYLQSYLDMARENIREIQKETGKISIKHFQLKVARGLEWQDLIHSRSMSDECEMNEFDDSSQYEFSSSTFATLHQAESVSEASKSLTLGLEELKKIFTTEFYRGVLGFTTWWCVFSWFLSSTFGVLYQSYFTKVE